MSEFKRLCVIIMSVIAGLALGYLYHMVNILNASSWGFSGSFEEQTEIYSPSFFPKNDKIRAVDPLYYNGQAFNAVDLKEENFNKFLPIAKEVIVSFENGTSETICYLALLPGNINVQYSEYITSEIVDTPFTYIKSIEIDPKKEAIIISIIGQSYSYKIFSAIFGVLFFFLFLPCGLAVVARVIGMSIGKVIEKF